MPDEFLIIFVVSVAVIVTVLTIRNILHAERTKKKVAQMNERVNGLHPRRAEELGQTGKPKP